MKHKFILTTAFIGAFLILCAIPGVSQTTGPGTSPQVSPDTGSTIGTSPGVSPDASGAPARDSYQQYRDRPTEPNYREKYGEPAAPSGDTRGMDKRTYDDSTGRFPGRGQGISPGETIVPRAGQGDLRERTVPDQNDRLLEEGTSPRTAPDYKNPAYK
ncbi:MAG: hypothetical protein ACYDHW_00340 [Syntrophorhabdaceae bacterium]